MMLRLDNFCFWDEALHSLLDKILENCQTLVGLKYLGKNGCKPIEMPNGLFLGHNYILAGKVLD
jgi:hypothetical protein